MANEKEDLLNALKICEKEVFCEKTECPYHEEDIDFGIEVCQLHKNMIEYLLREVEPKSTDEFHWYCGNCNRRLRLKLNLRCCPRCGVKIKWPAGIEDKKGDAD